MEEEFAATVLSELNTTEPSKAPNNTPVLLKDGDPGGGIYGRGGENAVKDSGVGDFSKHWHNTTEMAIVLTVIIVIPLAIFILFVMLAIIRRARHREQQQMMHRMQQQDRGGGGGEDDIMVEEQEQQHRDRDMGQCTQCLLIQIGEMACYHGVCPNCGRVPKGR